MNNGKIFLTGVAGMIGSNVARALLETGATIVGLDNLWRGSKRNLEPLLAYPQFTFRHTDLASDLDWNSDVKSEDIIVHLADIVAGIGFVFANEWSVFQKNVLINTNIARAVVTKVPRKLVYVGTACSYPQGLQRSTGAESRLNEAMKFPADPESGYGWSKLIGEIEFRLACKSSPTQLVVLDLHNVYGWPCAYSDSTAQVIPALIYKAARSQDGVLQVWGSGNQGRAFVHVRDVAQGVKQAVSYTGKHGCFMLGPEECTTIREVAELIKAHPRINIAELSFDTSKPTGDIGRSADSSLARRELGWEPQVQFRPGLYELIDRIVDDFA